MLTTCHSEILEPTLYPFSFVNLSILYLAFLPVARADFSDDQVPASPAILSHIISAAEKHGEPLRSTGDARSAYYLRSVRYVGECRAPFGTVHVAQLAFTRSAERGSRNPARGHSFIIFLDGDFRVRTVWRSDATGLLSISGTRLMLDGTMIFDYSQPPTSGGVIIDGKPHSYPKWK